MSQDSIFNVKPGNDAADQPNPFAGGTEESSPFDSVPSNETPYGAVQAETKIPDARSSSVPSDNPFQVVDTPEGTSFQKSTNGRMNEADHGQPFAITGLGVGQSNGASPVERLEPEVGNSRDTGGNPFAPVEAPQDFTAAEPALRPIQEASFNNTPEPVSQAEGNVFQQTPPAVEVATLDPNKQLELRAIFGVNRELNRDEILQLARSLPGIRNIGLIDAAGAQALDTMKATVSRLGFADLNSISLSCPGGVVDFISEGNDTLGILHEGQYAAGVKERLIIVCRELSKLA